MLTSTLNNTVTLAQKRILGKKTQTNKRHELIVKRFVVLKNFKYEGISLDYRQIIDKLVSEFGFATRTIEDIIKKGY